MTNDMRCVDCTSDSGEMLVLTFGGDRFVNVLHARLNVMSPPPVMRAAGCISTTEILYFGENPSTPGWPCFHPKRGAVRRRQQFFRFMVVA